MLPNQDELIAHVVFTTEEAPTAPTPLREYRASVTRQGNDVGEYLILLTDGCAPEDLEVIPTTWDNTGGGAWSNAVVTPFPGNAFLFHVGVFREVAGAIVLSDLADTGVRVTFRKVAPG